METLGAVTWTCTIRADESSIHSQSRSVARDVLPIPFHKVHPHLRERYSDLLVKVVS